MTTDNVLRVTWEYKGKTAKLVAEYKPARIKYEEGKPIDYQTARWELRAEGDQSGITIEPGDGFPLVEAWGMKTFFPRMIASHPDSIDSNTKKAVKAYKQTLKAGSPGRPRNKFLLEPDDE